jgi:ABC-2 type transport system ATP-binding protein
MAMGHRTVMIDIESVTKRRGRRTVLSSVSFRARPGRVTGFVGPNGAGKSSTLRILLGLDHATWGRALVGGRRYCDLPQPLRTVGAVLDGGGAHPSRTARAHLAWLAASQGIPGRRIDEVLDLVGLRGDARRRAGTYSLGMGQRLGLAAALLGDPEVLVLDEPVNGLDPAGVLWIRGLVRGHAAQGGTVLMSSHLMGELAEVADDIVVIADGRITAAGTIDDVVAPYGDLEAAFFALTGGAR